MNLWHLQIHDLTMELIHARQHGREMEAENHRLEDELDDITNKLKENMTNAASAHEELRNLVRFSEKSIVSS